MSVEYQGAVLNKNEANFLSEVEKIIGIPIPKVDRVLWDEWDNKENKSIKHEFGFVADKSHIIGLGLGKVKVNEEKNEKIQIFDNPLTQLPDSILNLMNLQYLDLSWNNLSNLPESIGKLTQLKRLDISHNSYHFKSLPKSLGKLKSLESLDLSGNGMLDALPETIGSLNSLKSLTLAGNGSLIEFPKSFGSLESLETLVLLRNGNLRIIPESFGHLKSLKELEISRNGNLKSFPETFGEKLQNLQTLKIIGNGKLENIPESFGKLRSLKYLTISSNRTLTTLPKSFGQLKSLKVVDLNKNNLTSLPDSFGELSSLVKLDISNNQLSSLPPSLGLVKTLKSLQLNNNKWDAEFKKVIKKSFDDLLDYLRKKASIFIFFSHAMEDYEEYKLKDIIDYLEKQNEIYKVYYCERDMTGDIDEFMKKFVSESQIMLFLATKNSVFNSQDCQFEVQEALKHGVEIIPIKSNQLDWSQLKEVNLDRKLGEEFSKENFNVFCENLYSKIMKLKRESNLFDKYQDKVKQISSKVKEVISEFIQTNDFSENLELNLDDFITIMSQYESMNISKDDFIASIFKLLSQK